MDELSVDLAPHRITAVEPEFKTKILVMENGYEQRFSNWHMAKRSYRLIWNFLSRSLTLDLIAFHTAQLGAAKSWEFTDSRLVSSPEIVRFTDDKLNVKWINSQFAQVGVTVITC